MDGISSVQTRIQDIISQFEGPPSASPVSGGAAAAAGSAGGNSDFASMLAQAQSTGATGANVPAATGVVNRAGVDPVQWAKDFLTRLGAPITASNVQAIMAWETAEGTRAAYNPLATTQGGYAGETTFNSVGVKNYATYQDGLDANVQVINNGLYSNILAALHQGDSAQAVARAVANSPWGTGTGVERVLAAGH